MASVPSGASQMKRGPNSGKLGAEDKEEGEESYAGCVLFMELATSGMLGVGLRKSWKHQPLSLNFRLRGLKEEE